MTRRTRARKISIWNNWRHFAAYVYLAICIFDFMGMPIFYEMVNPRTPDAQLVEIVVKLEPAAQVQALTVLHNERTWEALTLAQGGLFHMAFGAILGVAAFTRGQEKISYAKNGQPYGGSVYDDAEAEPEEEEFAPAPPRRSRSRRQEPETPDPFAEPTEINEGDR